MSEFLKVENLTKKYGDVCAVDNLSFSVNSNEIFGLLGPNGAGKSTTMNIISTLSEYQKGTVTVGGFDVSTQKNEVKKLIGMVPQDIAVYDFLSAIENVKFFASLYGLSGKNLNEASMKALEFVGLADKAKTKPKQMSGGMKRRLNIACGIAHSPKLIIMDEPTVGVDAQSREHILESIKLLRKNGATVIYTSHYMNEVEEICDRIAIIDHGSLIACGTENELVSLVTDIKTFRITTRIPASMDVEAFIKSTAKLPDVKAASVDENTVRVDTMLGFSDFMLIAEHMKANRLPIISVISEVPNLDSMFLTLTGHDMR